MRENLPHFIDKKDLWIFRPEGRPTHDLFRGEKVERGKSVIFLTSRPTRYVR